MRTTLLYGAVLAVILLSSSLLISRQNRHASDFVIGAGLCLSGGCAEWGENSKRGMLLAGEELNAGGGVLGKKISFALEDTRETGGSARAVSAFVRLFLDSRINYFIGPSWTPAARALTPLFLKKQEALITSPSVGVADFNEAADNIFNLWPHDAEATKAIALYAFKQGLKRMAVFSSDQDWEKVQGDVFEREFKLLGGKITSKIEPLHTITDLKALAAKVLESRPEGIFYSGFIQMGLAAKEFLKLGFRGKQLCILIDDSRIKESEGALEGAVVVRYRDSREEFVRKFKDRFGEPPGPGAATAYDAVMLYGRAIEKAKTFSTAKVRQLLASSSLDGASGKVSFDSFGGVRKNPVFYTVKDGRQVPLPGIMQ